MKATGRAIPGWAWVDGCECREVLIDWVLHTVYHPHISCPHYAQTTPLDVEDTTPL